MLDSRFVGWISLPLILSLAGLCNARVINIPDDFETIQGAIDNARSSDTILVDPGEYRENIIFPSHPVVIIGDPDNPEDVIIDGGGNGSVVTIDDEQDRNTHFTGFTVRHGTGVREEFTLHNIFLVGGGIYCLSSDPIISNCIIEENEAEYGGGMRCTDSDALIIDCIFRNNEAEDAGGFSTMFWGHPVLLRCHFIGNNARIGGAVCAYDAIEITECIFEDNQASFGGGFVCMEPLIFLGLNDFDYPPIAVFHSLFLNNAAKRGSAMYCQDFDTVGIINCSIIGNHNEFGGAVDGNNARVCLINCTVTENESEQSGGGVSISDGSEIFIFNSIIWNNEPRNIECKSDIFYSVRDTIVVSYSDVMGNSDSIEVYEDDTLIWGEGNIDENPIFADPDHGNYHLRENSPCIDAGSPQLIWNEDTLLSISENDYLGNAPDMGAFEFDPEDDVKTLWISQPESFILHPAYPNPFNSTALISYTIPVPMNILLGVYDLAGRKVMTLLDDHWEAGKYSVIWNADGMPAGVYLVIIQVTGEKLKKVQKVVLVK